jgi:hypothetical protein
MIRKLRFFIQRGRNGYSREDLWSFDTYLAGVIAAGCRELAEISHGAPGALLPTDGSNPSGVDESPEAFEQAMEEWREILDTIATGFEAYADSEDLEAPGFQVAFAKLRMWWGALWD